MLWTLLGLGRDMLNRSNSSSRPLRIRVLDLLLLVYKGNPKHVFKKGFLEREEYASFLSRVLYPESSLMSSTDVIP